MIPPIATTGPQQSRPTRLRINDQSASGSVFPDGLTGPGTTGAVGAIGAEAAGMLGTAPGKSVV